MSDLHAVNHLSFPSHKDNYSDNSTNNGCSGDDSKSDDRGAGRLLTFSFVTKHTYEKTHTVVDVHFLYASYS